MTPLQRLSESEISVSRSPDGFRDNSQQSDQVSNQGNKAIRNVFRLDRASTELTATVPSSCSVGNLMQTC